MKTPLLVLLLITALLASACASHSTTPAQPTTAAKLSPSQQYKNYVNQHANGVHAQVHWYNAPDDDDVAKFDFSDN